MNHNHNVRANLVGSLSKWPSCDTSHFLCHNFSYLEYPSLSLPILVPLAVLCQEVKVISWKSSHLLSFLCLKTFFSHLFPGLTWSYLMYHAHNHLMLASIQLSLLSVPAGTCRFHAFVHMEPSLSSEPKHFLTISDIYKSSECWVGPVHNTCFYNLCTGPLQHGW